MALVKFAPLVSIIRGKVGALVFGNTLAGPTVRINSFPKTRARSRKPFDYIHAYARSESYQRADLSVIVDRWASVLTQNQRDAWDALALTTRLPNILGEPRVPTGRALYVRTNRISSLFTALPFDNPPVRAVCETPVVTVTWVVPANEFEVGIGTTYLQPLDFALVWCSPPRPVTVNTFTDPFYFWLRDFIGNFPARKPGSAHEPGWRLCMAYWFRVRIITTTGALSYPVIVRAISD